MRFEHVHFAYPAGPEVLTDVDLTIPAQTRVAVVGETGSGKTTFAKLLTRLMDPTSGAVLLSGVPLTEVRFASLRRRVVMVPQDGFLFDATVADERPVRPAGPASDDDLVLAFTELGLADWVDGLPDGLDTPVGERGEALSRGGAAAGGAGPGVRRRPGPARPRRGDQRRRPGDRGAAAAHPRRGDPRAGPRSRSPTGCPPPRPPTR